MHLFTSNSDDKKSSLTPRIFIITAMLLELYWVFIQLIGWNVSFAETNLNAGLLRVQSLSDSRGDSAIIVGSSIIARLNKKMIFEQFNGDIINMGLDGGSTIFAMEKIIESNTSPQKILLEANRILVPPNKNMEIIDNVINSMSFKMASFFPILRREYRPVTFLYSKLKNIKDEKYFREKNNIDNDISTISIEYPSQKIIFDQKETNIAGQWRNIITRFQENDVSIVLVMIPDSNGHSRHKEYLFSRKLASKYNLPFIDLKKHLANSNLVYPDGTHLSSHSAQKVSKLLNILLLKNETKISKLKNSH